MDKNTHACNLYDFQDFSINDKVCFNHDNKPHIGVVTGFALNSVGELLIKVFDIYSNQERELHPRNSMVDLRNLTKE